MIIPISHQIAKSFIEQWHYSKRCPTGKNIFFGWYQNDILYAVADYGIGVNPYQAKYLSRVTGLKVEPSTLLELKRLCRIEPKQAELPLTKFIAQCHRLLRQMGYKYVISFSDPAYGHTGGIYKASNFKHLGQTNPENHVIDANGEARHRRLYFRHSRRNNISVAESRAELGLTLIKTVPKDRWFICIGR